MLRRGGETFLVQCKQWKAFKVGVEVVRELYGVMAAKGAAGGIVVTSGVFTTPALSFSEGRNIRLVDGPQLMRLIQQVRQARSSPPPQTKDFEDTAPALQPVTSTPICPKCSAPMVLRTAAKGPNAGSRFWGCSTFPACRGTRAETT